MQFVGDLFRVPICNSIIKMRNIISASVLFLFSAFSYAQVLHISNYFKLENQLTLTQYTEEESSKELVGYGDEQYIYFCKKRAFQNKETNYDAIIYTVNYKNGLQSTLRLPFPEDKKSLGNARKYWIYGISAYKDTILLATQTSNLLYTYENGIWKLANSISISNSDFSWLHQQHIYTISEDNSHGFKLWRAPLNEKSMTEVCKFNLLAHFLLQYGPNGFIKPDQKGNLYFINAPEMALHKYNIDGELLASCPIELPEWAPMSSDYINKINAMPYSSDRAMYAYFQSAKFSFPLEVLPINDNTFLLSYHHYDTIQQKESLKMLFIKIDHKWEHSQYERCTSTFSLNEIIDEEAFPIYTYQPELCLSLSIPNGVAQISKETMIDCHGMTGEEYVRAKEQFLNTHKPIMTLNIIKLKDEL